jgi:4-amino-4-deoxy-L-arabinose transferase-like glycosyltransferase
MSRVRPWRIALPLVLHLVLCFGWYQFGLSDQEMQRLHIEGPSHLIEPYVRAVHVFGPLGVVRVYLRGTQDERLYLEYSRLLLRGRVDMAYVADRQNDPDMNRKLPARAWPYRDVRVEYPPGAFLATLPPALITLDPRGYRSAFIGYMLLLHLLNLFLAAKLLQPSAAENLERILWASLLFMAGLGLVVVTRLDHAVVTLSLLTLLAYARASARDTQHRLAWAAACGVLAAVGVMVKLVPGLAGLAAGVLFLQQRERDGVRCALVAAASGLVALVLMNAVMLALAGDAYLATFRYHTQRGVQIESLYAGLLMLLKPLGLAMHVEESFGSTNLASCATGLVKKLSPLLFVAGAGAILLLRRFRRDGSGAMLLTCVLFLLFMLTNRVFSPQYLIWIGAPLCVLAARERASPGTFWLLLFAIVLSQLIFPRGYPVLKALHPLAIVVLNLRNLLLIDVTIRLVRTYSRPASSPESEPAGA